MPRASGYDAGGEAVPVYILAGGHSRRFGRDKARALIGGKPAIMHIADTLSSFGGPTTVVARHAGAYDDLGLRTIGDAVADKGPIGGLLTALLDHGATGWVLVTACDWVGLRSEWAFELQQHVRTDAGAVVFRSDRYEPLFGLYHASIRQDIERLLSRDVLAMQTLLDTIETVTRPSPFARAGVVNWNDASQQLPSDGS